MKVENSELEAPMEQTIQQTENIESQEANVTQPDGDIYQYVSIPADSITTMSLNNSSSTTQYYEGEELLVTALTDEDRKLAAALVDVHYKNQQPQSSVIANPMDTTSTTYTIDTGDGDAGVNTFIQQETRTYDTNSNATSEEKKSSENNTKKAVENNARETSATGTTASSLPTTRIIFKSSPDGKYSSSAAKKSLPHKKRMAVKAAPPLRSKNTKTYFSCTKCGDIFMSETDLITHKVEVHRMKKPKPVRASAAKAAASSFQCQLCQESFSDQMVFFAHLKAHYEPKVERDSEEEEVEGSQDMSDRDGGVSDQEQETVVRTVYLTGRTDDIDYSELNPNSTAKEAEDSGQVMFTVVKSESPAGPYSCSNCSRSFRRQKALESHMSAAHPKEEEEFSEPEDMMEGLRHVVNIIPADGDEDKSNIVIRSWSPLGTTLLSEQASSTFLPANHYTEVLDHNMTAQHYEAFETINVQLAGSEPHDGKTISVTLVPIHEASTEDEIIAASSNEDWKGTVVLLEDKPSKPKVKREKGVKKEKKQLICQYCNRVFKYRNTLVYHLRTHTGEKPHMCDNCGKSFFSSTALKVHSRIHAGSKPYPCDICGRAFRQWGDLKYHKTSLHTDVKAFQCEYCGKDFARKYSLVVHRRIHTGERNYQCEFCHKAFRASSYLQNHRRIHTGEKPHFCPVCNKLFRVRSDMKRHLNTHNVDAREYLTVTGNQTGVMVPRVKTEKIEYAPPTSPEPNPRGKRGRRDEVPVSENSQPFSSDISEDHEMEEVETETVHHEVEEDEHLEQTMPRTEYITSSHGGGVYKHHKVEGEEHLEQPHHMEEVYTSKGMYVWVDDA